MKKLSVAFALALLSFSFSLDCAHAEALAGIGTGMSFEYAADGRTLETRQPLALRGGYSYQRSLDFYLEYQTYRTSQGTAMVYVAREHSEWLLWVRKTLFAEWKFAPFVAGGAGLMYDTIETSFAQQATKDSGGSQSLFALAGGGRAQVWRQLEIAIEGRMSYSSTFNPNPMFALGLTAGVKF